MIYRLDRKSLWFPDPEEAVDEYNGLLAIGGDYSPERLLLAYSSGIFPWPISEEMPVTWFSPNPRFVLMAADLHIPRSLERVLKKGIFTFTKDTVFPEVIHACASVPRRGEEGTWITGELEEGYCELWRRGHAHSFEAWRDGELVGGFYGVAVGKCFFGESMFARVPDASKCAFAHFAKKMFEEGTPWIDCQVHTEHLARFGAKEIPRREYIGMLAAEMEKADYGR